MKYFKKSNKNLIEVTEESKDALYFTEKEILLMLDMVKSPNTGGEVYCKNCHRLIPKAHPNKKFCSNSGRGNCKDAYHNKKVWDGDGFDVGSPYSAGYFGHGQE